MERDRARVESWPTTAAGGGITLTRRPAEDALRAVSRCAVGKKQRGARRCEEEGKADRRDPLVSGSGQRTGGGKVNGSAGQVGPADCVGASAGARVGLASARFWAGVRTGLVRGVRLAFVFNLNG